MNQNSNKKVVKKVKGKRPGKVKKNKNKKDGNVPSNAPTLKHEGKFRTAVVPVKAITPANNVTSIISISVPACAFARATYSCGIISRVVAADPESIGAAYAIYLAMDQDFVNTVTNATQILTQRMAYVNTIFELIKAKTVVTPELRISYAFSNVNTATVPAPAINIRGFNYYMYNGTGDSGNALVIMDPPPSVDLSIAVKEYTGALPLMQGSDDKKLTRTQPTDEASKIFSGDGTAYAERSLYIGSTGSCPSGGYGSAELEVYGKAMRTLSVFAELPPVVLRTAHYLCFASGDSCAAFSYPYLNGFKMLDYSTSLPPIIKYIDFAQLWVVWSNWFAETIRKSLIITTDTQTATDYLAARVPHVYAVLAFRQSILKYFAQSQGATQFQAYQYRSNNYFEALRCGTNALSLLDVPLMFPAFLVENCRSLAAKRYCDTNKFAAEKKCQWYIPCIGMFPDVTLVNPVIDVGGVPTFIFNPATGVPAEATINYIDGSTTTNVYDMNSYVVQNAANILNGVIDKLSQVSGDTGSLEGTSNFNLLAFTRHDVESVGDFSLEIYESTPEWMITDNLRTMREDYIRQKSVFDELKKKSKSTGQFKYIIAQSPDTLIPRMYSSSMVITKELQSVLQMCVVPSILDFAPTATLLNPSGVQSAFSETQYYSVNQAPGAANTFPSSVSQIFTNVGVSLAPGTAADPKSEVARVMEYMQTHNGGGFLEAALAGVGAFVSAL